MPKLEEIISEETKKELEKLAQKLKRAEDKCNESQLGDDRNGKKGSKRGKK